jgi:hypothetical protein
MAALAVTAATAVAVHATTALLNFMCFPLVAFSFWLPAPLGWHIQGGVGHGGFVQAGSYGGWLQCHRKPGC